MADIIKLLFLLNGFILNRIEALFKSHNPKYFLCNEQNRKKSNNIKEI